MKNIENIKGLVNKKFRKALAIGAIATSLAISPLSSVVNLNTAATAEAKQAKKAKKIKKAKKKYKVKIKRTKGKKNKTILEGKNDVERYSVKLKKGRKKIKAKKYSVILRRKQKVLKVTPKAGITDYSKLVGVSVKKIKKGNKMKGFKVKYSVDDNVKVKLRETIIAKVTSVDGGKKKVKNKKIKNIRIIKGKSYDIPYTSEQTTIPTQNEIDATYEQETGEKLNIVVTPSPIPSFDSQASIVEEPENSNEGVTFYDDNGNTITDPNYTPEPLPTVEPTLVPNATPLPTETPIVSTHGNITVVSDKTSYDVAEERLLDQNYGNGIVLNSIDPLINTLYFNAGSNILEDSSYLDYLKLNAQDANKNDISNNIKVYDYNAKNISGNNENASIIIEVTDNNGNLYSQYMNVSTRDINDTNDMLTGPVVLEDDSVYQTYYDVYLLSIEPIIFAQTDKMQMKKENIFLNEENVSFDSQPTETPVSSLKPNDLNGMPVEEDYTLTGSTLTLK